MADPQFCLLAVDHWSMCMTKAEWSGWVQAVGSVAAIAAGAAGLIWQVQRQHHLALALEEKQMRSLTARALAPWIDRVEAGAQVMRDFEKWRVRFNNGEESDERFLRPFYDELFQMHRQQLHDAAQVDYPLLLAKHSCEKILSEFLGAYFTLSTTQYMRKDGGLWREVLSEAPAADLKVVDEAVATLRSLSVQP